MIAEFMESNNFTDCKIRSRKEFMNGTSRRDRDSRIQNVEQVGNPTTIIIFKLLFLKSLKNLLILIHK